MQLVISQTLWTTGIDVKKIRYVHQDDLSEQTENTIAASIGLSTILGFEEAGGDGFHRL